MFDKSLFDEIKVAMDNKIARAAEDPLVKQDENLQLEQDVIVPLAAARKIYVHETTDFWRQMKTAAYVIIRLYPTPPYHEIMVNTPHISRRGIPRLTPVDPP